MIRKCRVGLQGNADEAGRGFCLAAKQAADVRVFATEFLGHGDLDHAFTHACGVQPDERTGIRPPRQATGIPVRQRRGIFLSAADTLMQDKP
jgi:hypothetical protein